MRRFVLGILLFASIGCERVVGVDLEEGPKRLVIEARLERVAGRESGRQRIRLTTTDDYFSNTMPPAARGATVQITDDAGRVVAFAESAVEPGIYETTALAGEVGRVYTLSISYLGEMYRSSEQLLPVTRIDSLFFAEPSHPLGSEKGLRATISLRDPAGAKNFYLWDQLVDGVRILSADSTLRGRVVSSDQLDDGRRIRRFQPYDGVEVKPGQQVVVRQMAISEAAYRYYLALSEQAANDGSPFGVAPASLRGNVANVSRAANFPLGYFIAGEVAEASAQVPVK